MLADLKTKFIGFELRSPIIVSSAGITANLDRMKRAEDNGAGAVIMKGISDQLPMRISPTPRFRVIKHDLAWHKSFTLYSYEQASEWGPQEYAEEVVKTKEALDIPVIANVACIHDESWVEYIKVIQEAGIDAFELNVSCPHGSLTFCGEEVEKSIIRAIKLVKEHAKVPLILKLSPQLTQPGSMFKAAEAAGVNGITIFNRLTGLDIDIEEEVPVMHGGYAGHGGPWAINYALRWISAMYPEAKVDISGSGGVMSYEDIVKYILAGATTVQTCTAIYLEGYEVINKFNRGLAEYMDRKGYATLDEFRGAIVNKIKTMNEVDRRHTVMASIDFKGSPPCRVACPIDQEAQGYISLVAEGKYQEALTLIKEANPFPGICGRVCHHPCETECTRNDLNEPVSIAMLKRFVADKAANDIVRPLPERKYDEKVAVIGSGPAGLTAAQDLAFMGYGVTVFEALPVAGGMMKVGIPEYRLPKNIIEQEIADIEAMGIEIKTNSPIGKDTSIDDLFKQDYKAVLVATGAHKSQKLGVHGEELDGVLYGVDFLRNIGLGEKSSVGKKVLVIGGGNVAIDSARSALRLGAEDVTIVYRRSKNEMPAFQEEIEEAKEEGINFIYLASPTRLIDESGKVCGVEIVYNTLGDADESGRRRPVPVQGSEQIIAADMVIIAVGQRPDLKACNGYIDGTERRLPADECFTTTEWEGIFAAGDAVMGPATVVEAIAAGRRGAVSIHRFLRGEDIKEGRPTKMPDMVDKKEILSKVRVTKKRQRGATLPIGERLKGFAEVNLGFTEEQALEEARRCLQCATCANCGECVRKCIYRAITKEDGRTFVTDKCDGCAICTYFCHNNALSMVPKA